MLWMCLSAGMSLLFYQLYLWAPGIEQNFCIFLSGKDRTLCGLVNWEHLQSFSSQRCNRIFCKRGDICILCRPFLEAAQRMLLERPWCCAFTRSSSCIQSTECHWRGTAAFQAALQTPCGEFSASVGNCASGERTALLHSLRQRLTPLTSRDGGGGNWAPTGSWATTSGVPVTRIYSAYSCIHLPQLHFCG